MKQVSKTKPATKAPACQSENEPELPNSNPFASSAVLAANIAGSRSAIIARLDSDHTGTLLATHGPLPFDENSLLNWIELGALTDNEASASTLSPEKAPPAITSSEISAPVVVRHNAVGAQYMAILRHGKGGSIRLSDKYHSMLAAVLEQVHQIDALRTTARSSVPETIPPAVHLAHDQKLLGTLLDHVPDRLFVKDMDGRILQCTLAMAVAHGFETKEELFGKTVWDLYEKKQARQLFDEESGILKGTGSILNRAQASVDLQGNPVWLSVTKVPIRNDAGTIAGLIGIARDVTRIKQSEAQLAKARDAAMESARVKSAFLANMSHELRTPLNGILGMDSLLTSTGLTRDQTDIVDTIHMSAENLLDIIDEVLDFSKGEAGKLTLEEIEFDLNDIVDGVLDLFSEHAQMKGLQLTATPLPEGMPDVIGDPGKLRQILVNLVGNAIKFTDEGGVSIALSHRLNSNGMLVVTTKVCDSGPGVPDQSGEALFDPFTQADDSTTRKYGGTGLGLAISRQIVEQMGGEIGVRAGTDRGAEFWFKLALPIVDACAAQTTGSESTTRGSNRLKILTVQPESAINENLSYLLERLGHEVENQPDISRAKQWISDNAETHCWDVLMVDLEHAGTHEPDELKRLFDQSAASRLPCVLISVRGQSGPAPQDGDEHAKCVLTKPVKQKHLIHCLDECARAKKLSRFAKPSGTEDTATYRRRHGLGKQRVLLVEENSSNQKLIIQLLNRLGYRADPAGSGQEAIDSLKLVHYPVVLINCRMSEMNGFETARAIRRLETQDSQPGPGATSHIIGMSSRIRDDELDACERAGIDDCIASPVRKEDLKTAMAQAVSRLRNSHRMPITLSTGHARKKNITTRFP